jgi:hypothetical protein
MLQRYYLSDHRLPRAFLHLEITPMRNFAEEQQNTEFGPYIRRVESLIHYYRQVNYKILISLI